MIMFIFRFKAVFCALSVLVALLITVNSSHAGSPVWKVSKNGHYFYLGATIHLLKQSDYPLPAAFNVAYADSSILVFETDIDALSGPEGQMKIMSSAMLPAEKTLKSELRPDTWTALDSHMKEKGIPIFGFAKFKPGMVAMTLTVLEMQTQGYSADMGVDMHYLSRANKDGKTKGFLESVDVQLALLSMDGWDGDEMILYTLRDLKRISDILDELKRAWKNGEADNLDKLAGTEMKKNFPGVYKKLVTDRNNNWLPELEKYSQTKDVELILVGGLHLTGSEGLLNQLKKRGFNIENLK